MHITNLTTNEILSTNAVMASSLISKSLGLLRYSNPQTIILNTRFGIHTLGMKFPIDVLILDTSQKVVKLHVSLRPNRFFFWPPQYSTVIELPEGTIKKTKTKRGDNILIE